MAKEKKKTAGKSTKKRGSMPMWAQLRVAYGYATTEERAQFKKISNAILKRKKIKPAALPGPCKPSGCESASSTGGCKPGTSCLFSGLQ
ncbi:MAG: hypothetical protein HY026_03680 [Deltaproteobacteria bacterium]|nr:hypothetical protein [Deltaproteobacteria bacterium]